MLVWWLAFSNTQGQDNQAARGSKIGSFCQVLSFPCNVGSVSSSLETRCHSSCAVTTIIFMSLIRCIKILIWFGKVTQHKRSNVVWPVARKYRMHVKMLWYPQIWQVWASQRWQLPLQLFKGTCTSIRALFLPPPESSQLWVRHGSTN